MPYNLENDYLTAKNNMVSETGGDAQLRQEMNQSKELFWSDFLDRAKNVEPISNQTLVLNADVFSLYSFKRMLEGNDDLLSNEIIFLTKPSHKEGLKMLISDRALPRVLHFAKGAINVDIELESTPHPILMKCHGKEDNCHSVHLSHHENTLSIA